jgi:hypothetical protein
MIDDVDNVEQITKRHNISLLIKKPGVLPGID